VPSQSTSTRSPLHASLMMRYDTVLNILPQSQSAVGTSFALLEEAGRPPVRFAQAPLDPLTRWAGSLGARCTAGTPRVNTQHRASCAVPTARSTCKRAEIKTMLSFPPKNVGARLGKVFFAGYGSRSIAANQAAVQSKDTLLARLTSSPHRHQRVREIDTHDNPIPSRELG
jgi:hypothetical protein